MQHKLCILTVGSLAPIAIAADWKLEKLPFALPLGALMVLRQVISNKLNAGVAERHTQPFPSHSASGTCTRSRVLVAKSDITRTGFHEDGSRVEASVTLIDQVSPAFPTKPESKPPCSGVHGSAKLI